MGVLRGSINSKMANVSIPDGSVLRILLFDGSDRFYNSEQPSKARLIAKTEIYNPKNFPIDYKLDYPNPTTKKHFYFLSVYIEKNSNVLYHNKLFYGPSVHMFQGEEFGDLISINNSKLRGYLDVYLMESE
ncbi:unnamed protein product [Brachionus calyciflorus]|uniref:Uncharacterized protein n=1 Tax=Brachionus calyciflorus TaxID=104777 RepID=A0A813N5M7_9BILA|nr:unnamed protein product [Brachionus calyciflorus]